MRLPGDLQELTHKGKYFKVGEKAAFARGWAAGHAKYEHLPGTIVELGTSVVRIAYDDNEVYGPAPDNAYPIHSYKNNKEATGLLSQEEY